MHLSLFAFLSFWLMIYKSKEKWQRSVHSNYLIHQIIWNCICFYSCTVLCVFIYTFASLITVCVCVNKPWAVFIQVDMTSLLLIAITGGMSVWILLKVSPIESNVSCVHRLVIWLLPLFPAKTHWHHIAPLLHLSDLLMLSLSPASSLSQTQLTPTQWKKCAQGYWA